MHEYSLVQALIERVDAEARRLRAGKVHRVIVRIGPVAGVERALFVAAFENTKPGTICDGAELEVRGETVRWKCPACASEVPEGHVPACPQCGWPARLVEGDGLVLERLELEVPDNV